jgi:hypothetical protein
MYKKFLRTSLVLVGLLSLSSTLVSASAPTNIPNLSKQKYQKMKDSIELWPMRYDIKPWPVCDPCPGGKHLTNLATELNVSKKTIAVKAMELGYQTQEKGIDLIRANGGFRSEEWSDGSYLQHVNEECRESGLIDDERYQRWERHRHAANLGRHHLGEHVTIFADTK